MHMKGVRQTKAGVVELLLERVDSPIGPILIVCDGEPASSLSLSRKATLFP